MTVFTALRAARPALPAVAAFAVLAVVPTLPAGTTASAAPASAAAWAGLSRGGGGVGAANGRVHRVLDRVHLLDRQVAAAEKRYAAALSGVARSVTSTIAADQDQSAVQALLNASQQTLRQQVVGLYASGGGFATDAALLAPTGLSAYDSSRHAMSTAISQTEATARQQQAAAAAAAAAELTAGRQARHRIATARSVAGVAAKVQQLLSDEQQALNSAQQQLSDAKALQAAQQAFAAEAQQFSSDTTSGVDAVGILPPSAEYLSLYRHAAATCPGLPWTALAAIGQVESGHGRSDGPSSAGAEGPMQFEPGTFAAYAVDGDHDGKVNIDDPADSIYTAARYLCANGGGRGPSALANAIFDYNHAAWYVQLVLGLAAKYAAAYGS